MARFDRMTVLNKMVEVGMIPVFFHADKEVVKKIALACSAGGAKVIEFTNRGDFAPTVFLELSQFLAKEAPEVILGVGSIVDPATAALYISYGANFLVGPYLNPEVAKLANRRKIAYSPGCGSATEIGQAEELGVEICKVFPGSSVGGPTFIKSVLAPTPWSKLMPTGGVEATEESLSAWFKAGVACVGMGSNLVSADLLKAGDYEGITKNVVKALALVRKVRGKGTFSGVEHVGIYPNGEADAMAIAQWYEKVFGFKVKEGKSSIFVQGDGAGRIEINREKGAVPCHIAVTVTNFEAALEELKARGVELEEANVKPDVKAVYLKESDPAGNRIHLLWRA